MKNTLKSVLIVEDHTLVRTGLRRLIQDHPSVDTVIESDSGEQALQHVKRCAPDLIIMDLSLPGIGGAETSLRLLKRDQGTRIIVLTGSTEEHTIQSLLKAGVLGYLTKGCSTEEMCQAIDEVLAGRQYLSSDVARSIALSALRGQNASGQKPEGQDNDGAPAASPFDELTRRELEIAMLLLDGKRNNQIGDTLFISEKTVSSHRSRAFGKLGVESTIELARLAIAHGVWIDQVHS